MGVDARRPRSAALDGLRGVTVFAFLASAFAPTAVTGAWTGVNLFFVLSGFLVVRLLERERMRSGHVDVRAFYLRRARRLLPALVTLLSVVTVWAVFWADRARRRSLGEYVLASLGFVQNWRLIALDGSVGSAADPTPLGHVWAVAVAGQLSVLAPVVVGLLALLLGSRPARAAALLGLAVLSAWWTVHLAAGGAPLSRVHHGTDACLQAFLVGAALGDLLARRPRWLPEPNPRLAAAAGVALAISAAAFAALSPSVAASRFGVTLGLAVVQAVLVAALADPGTPARHGLETRSDVLGRVLGWAPFAYAGRRAYGLYLWHWPVHLWLTPSLLGSRWAAGAAGVLVTFAVADLSWRFLEEPVIRGGIRAVLPNARSRLVASALPIAVLALVAVVVLRGAPVPAA
jgi:peptidoglycan/LPS O-acetylase OafA/YrhL